MLVDYHMHTPLCGHAQGKPEEYVQKAQEEGLDQIGFSGHLPLFHLPLDYPYQYLKEPLSRLERYVECIRDIQKTYPDVPIKLGIEVDYFPEKEREIAEVLSFPFDYVIGSVHFARPYSLYDEEFYRRFSSEEVFARYFPVVEKAVASGLFDVIAHFDVPKLYCSVPENLLELAEPALLAMAEEDTCLEINSAGFRTRPGESYPGPLIIKRAWELGIPITLGSDAHHPEHVAFAFDKTVEMLTDIGYNEIATFEGRSRIMVPLGW